MANKSLFGGAPTSEIPAANTVNAAGGKAYEMTSRHALAQIACTNCFNGTYYADAESNLKIAKEAVAKLHSDPEFIAKVAVYARNKAYMKDMPAYLVAVLATLDSKLFRQVFPKIIDNGKMLRNFIQIGRSGQAGKKLNVSSGSVRRAINTWFESHTSEFIFRASIGNDPTMRDILRMARPRPENEEKRALYGYLVSGKAEVFSHLPAIVQQYENFKKNHEGEIPKVDFRMLDSILTKEEACKMWESQARHGGWQMTRMNLNNFQKYGVFNSPELVKAVADKLSNKEEIVKARAYPYQLLMAYNAAVNVPAMVRESLQDAMETALENTPAIDGQIYICVDTSGSMRSAITGYRAGATSSVRCLDVAALVAAAMLRKNKLAEVLLFDTVVHSVNVNPRDSVMTNAQKFARNGGGTDCGCALRELNSRQAKGSAVIFISDNESWVNGGGYYGRGTSMLDEWSKFKNRNQKSKLVCVDLIPNTTSQVAPSKEILQCGGWSDASFDVIADFIKYGASADHWVDVIEKIEI